MSHLPSFLPLVEAQFQAFFFTDPKTKARREKRLTHSYQFFENSSRRRGCDKLVSITLIFLTLDLKTTTNPHHFLFRGTKAAPLFTPAS